MIEILIGCSTAPGDLYDDLCGVADKCLYRQFPGQGVDGIRQYRRHDQG